MTGHSLEDIEVALTMLMNDLLELDEGDEGRGALERELEVMLGVEARKVDAVAKVLARLETAADECDAESKRLMDRRNAFVAKRRRLVGYVLDVMERTGTKRMDGALNSFVRIQNPQRAEAGEPAALPLKFQRHVYVIRPQTDEEKKDVEVLAESLRATGLSIAFEAQPDLAALREALKNGPVPGATLVDGAWRLAVR